MKSTISRPVLKYYGGKFKIAPWIISHFPRHEAYCEPFSGSWSVGMLKTPCKYEIFNDLNDEVVNLFRVLRDPVQADALDHALSLTPYSRSEWEFCFEKCEDPIEQARRTVVKSMMSIQWQGTKNPTGFSVSTDGNQYLPKRFNEYRTAMQAFTSRLKNVIIEKTDAVQLMKKNDRKAMLFYVDPPYLTRKNMRKGYDHELKTEAEHENLLTELRKLKGMVVLSGYDHPMYFDMLRDWKVYKTETVNGARTAGKCKAIEYVFLNPQANACKRQLELL
jgi:DNA adenine methylase